MGTSLVTGSGHPTCSFVYKLVARASDDDPASELVPVEKKSANKATVGGRKFALRRLNDRGVAEAEVVGVGQPPQGDHNDRAILVELVKGGEVVGAEPLEAARERHAAVRAELPRAARKMSAGDPVIPTILLEEES